MKKLANWLRVARRDEREALAALAGTTVGYLYQLAGGHRVNPSAKLVQGLVQGAAALHRARHKLPPLSHTDFS